MLISSVSVSASYDWRRNSTTGVIYQINSLSVAENVAEVRTAINEINKMRASGSVTDEQLITLASRLFTLENSVLSSNEGVVSDVISVIKEAENAVVGLSGSGADKVKTTVDVVRKMLDIKDAESNSNSETEKAPVFDAKDIYNLKGFYDLGNHEWARPAIEDMSTGTYKGLFSGKTAPNAQGLAQFDPDGRMSRAEFITVVMRILFPDIDYTPQTGQPWWQVAYDNALGKIVEKEDAFSYTKYIEDDITRQEMALILTRACEFKSDEEAYSLVSKERISDYDEVGGIYKHAVRVAFSKGLIAGKDTSGRFAPRDTLTRAEGAAVLYRLVNSSKRVDLADVWGTITIYEGQERYNRNAREGDIFIKKDGTQIVLKKGPNGILGEGQGVAADAGLLGKIGEYGCENFTYKVADYGTWYDSTGIENIQHCLQNQDYWVNRTTGEGYWGSELRVLSDKYPAPYRDENPGSYEGQISSDPYSLWVWKYGDWWYNFNKGAAL